MATILSLIRDAADELGVDQPSGLFAVTDTSDVVVPRLKRSLRRCIDLLANDWDWQSLRRERTFTSVASETQTGMLPSDFRRFVPETFWDRSSRFRLAGPVPPDQWQTAKTWNSSAVVPYFCVRGNQLLTFPAPAAGRTYAFEYITSAVGRNAAGSELAAFSNETDVTWWPDELMITGIVMHYRMIERQDSAAEQQVFEKLKADAIKQDGGRRVISMRGANANSADARLAAMKSNATIVNSDQWGGTEW